MTWHGTAVKANRLVAGSDYESLLGKSQRGVNLTYDKTNRGKTQDSVERLMLF
jgi:hypothetical protein